jgi:AAA+ superfamily predicted ATPase
MGSNPSEEEIRLQNERDELKKQTEKDAKEKEEMIQRCKRDQEILKQRIEKERRERLEKQKLEAEKRAEEMKKEKQERKERERREREEREEEEKQRLRRIEKELKKKWKKKLKKENKKEKQEQYQKQMQEDLEKQRKEFAENEQQKREAKLEQKRAEKELWKKKQNEEKELWEKQQREEKERRDKEEQERQEAFSQQMKVHQEEIKILKAKLEEEEKNSKFNIENRIEKQSFSTSFSDILNLEDLQKRLKNTVIKISEGTITNQQASIKNILLYGPPGCGKTSLVHSLANEYQSFKFIVITPSTLDSEIAGKKTQLIKELFDLAYKQPSILFFDDCESFFQKRSVNDPIERTAVLNEFLIRLDINRKNNSPVYIIAATNLPFNFDTAVLSRFSAKFFLDLPVSKNRFDLLEKYLSNDEIPLDEVKQIATEISERTNLFSYRELNSLYYSAKDESELFNIPFLEAFNNVFEYCTISYDPIQMKHYELFKNLKKT